MKFILVMIFCTALYEQCQKPYPMSESYNNFYSCMVAGYEEAKRKTLEVGKEQVNKDYTYIKFYCTPDTRPEI
tara:strand:+ start:196 stop:414 length:219 start_codon:yes stop_codon:yes gene_type:complete